jgi:hypothetical protein
MITEEIHKSEKIILDISINLDEVDSAIIEVAGKFSNLSSA